MVSVLGVKAQTPREQKEIVDNYNEKLINYTNDKIETYLINKSEKINNYLRQHPDVSKKIINGHSISVLHNIIDGYPIYLSNDNIIGLEGARTNFIQPNGQLGLNLEGENMTMAYWEVGGKPLDTHDEFLNTGTSRIVYSDSSIDTTFHATHVAGILIANGVRSDAKGMAPKAILKSYNEDNDLLETQNEATNNGLLISNHSYGIPVRNVTNSWFMGAYVTEAQKWDELANNAPFYLAVFSAGNSGLDEYEGGLKDGYDKLTSFANSKNNLVVANASEVKVKDNGDISFGSSKINASSSQGPSDDGRIKPDITGMGTQILSSSKVTNSTYARATGTSMSSPNVAGSLLLLQELYNFEYNRFMLASTLKCLALNTATTGGLVDGPDARFGWGIVDIRKAANIILQKSTSNSIINEDLIINGESKTIQITAKGGEDVRAMIVWNDPAGQPIEGKLNDPTPALVNDLDLRVKTDTETFLPWRLDLNDVSLPAKKGDNVVDNVEQVIVENPSAGSTYTIEISHKGALVNENQKYSLVVTGISATTLGLEDFDSNSITFWPNPVKNQLNISSSEINFSTDVQVSVFDMLGREVITKKNFNSPSNLSLDTSILSKGIYILNLTDGSRSIQKRIIKE